MSKKNPKEILQELKKYEKNNKTLAKYKSPLIFENSDSPHASIVLKNIVEFSDREVLIYDKDLSGDLSGDGHISETPSKELSADEKELEEFIQQKRTELLAVFERHLESGKNLFIVVDEVKNTDSVTYRKLEELADKFPYFLSVTTATLEFKQSIEPLEDAEKRKVSYMAVGDMTSYRVQVKLDESLVEEEESFISGRNAFVCYNDPKTAQKLGAPFKENKGNLIENSVFNSRAAVV